MWIFNAPFIHQKKEIDIYIYIYTHTHTHTYIFISVPFTPNAVHLRIRISEHCSPYSIQQENSVFQKMDLAQSSGEIVVIIHLFRWIQMSFTGSCPGQ
jgi:hypothetical protein